MDGRKSEKKKIIFDKERQRVNNINISIFRDSDGKASIFRFETIIANPFVSERWTARAP